MRLADISAVVLLVLLVILACIVGLVWLVSRPPDVGRPKFGFGEISKMRGPAALARRPKFGGAAWSQTNTDSFMNFMNMFADGISEGHTTGKIDVSPLPQFHTLITGLRNYLKNTTDPNKLLADMSKQWLDASVSSNYTVMFVDDDIRTPGIGSKYHILRSYGHHIIELLSGSNDNNISVYKCDYSLIPDAVASGALGNNVYTQLLEHILGTLNTTAINPITTMAGYKVPKILCPDTTTGNMEKIPSPKPTTCVIVTGTFVDTPKAATDAIKDKTNQWYLSWQLSPGKFAIAEIDSSGTISSTTDVFETTGDNQFAKSIKRDSSELTDALVAFRHLAAAESAGTLRGIITSGLMALGATLPAASTSSTTASLAGPTTLPVGPSTPSTPSTTSTYA